VIGTISTQGQTSIIVVHLNSWTFCVKYKKHHVITTVGVPTPLMGKIIDPRIFYYNSRASLLVPLHRFNIHVKLMNLCAFLSTSKPQK